MTGQRINILHIAAGADDRPLFELVLRQGMLEVDLETLSTPAELLTRLPVSRPAVVLADAALPWITPSELVGVIRAHLRDVPIILLGAPSSVSMSGPWEGVVGPLEKSPATLYRLSDIVGHALATRFADAPTVFDPSRALQALFTDSGKGMFRCRPDGQLLWANAAFRRALGLSDGEEITALNLHELGAFPGEISGRLIQLRQTGRLAESRVAWRRIDGSEIQGVFSAVAIREDGQTVFLGVLDDQTDRDEQLRVLERKARRLEESNRELERFASVVSHELQEPLRAIERYTRILEEETQDYIEESAGESLSLIGDGARRMRRLVDDLLTYSRVISRENRLVAVDTGQALGEAIDSLEDVIRETGARIERDPLPVVHADYERLVSVFRNLLSNALKYRRDEIPHIRIYADEQAGGWTFSVADNGIGIAREDAERVFGIFQRLHPTTRYPGTGVGLAVVDQIVRRHGGRAWVESEPGKGSTFFFFLPRSHETPAAGNSSRRTDEQPTSGAS